VLPRGEWSDSVWGVQASQVKVRLELPSGEEGVPASLVAVELAQLNYQGKP